MNTRGNTVGEMEYELAVELEASTFLPTFSPEMVAPAGTNDWADARVKFRQNGRRRQAITLEVMIFWLCLAESLYHGC